MGFLRDLIEVRADGVKLSHHGEVIGRRRVGGNEAVNQATYICLLGQAGFFYALLEVVTFRFA